jgi:hypothetical protein
MTPWEELQYKIRNCQRTLQRMLQEGEDAGTVDAVRDYLNAAEEICLNKRKKAPLPSEETPTTNGFGGSESLASQVAKLSNPDSVDTSPVYPTLPPELMAIYAMNHPAGD